MADDLIQQLEDAEKHEKLIKFWNENGSYIIGGAILAIFITAAMSFWTNWQTKTNQSQTSMIIAAMEQRDTNPEKLTDIIPNLQPGLRGLASLSAAGAMLEDNKPAEALEIFKNAAADKQLPAEFREMAELMTVRIGWDQRDTKIPAKEALVDYMAQLQPLINDTNSPWHTHANIQAAVMMADAGEFVKARSYLAPLIQSKDIPISLRERARALDGVYVLKIPPKQKETQKETPTAAPKDKPEAATAKGSAK